MNRAQATAVIAALELPQARATVRAPAPRIMSRREIAAEVEKLEAGARWMYDPRFGRPSGLRSVCQPSAYALAQQNWMRHVYGAPARRDGSRK